MKLASGIAPVPEYLAAGVTVGLGTDGAASNNDLDMFEAMRFAALLHKVKTGDPRAFPATTALEMATIGGARALGLEKQIGSLEAGKRADLVVVSMASARQTPLYDPVSHLVYASRGDDVRTVIVNGRVLMRDRKMLTLDEPAVLAEARKMPDAVRAAVGKDELTLLLDADERQMAELAGIVETVSDDEFVLDLEADIFDLDVDLPPARLAQQARGSQALRVSRSEHVLEIVQRQTGVDDVFDDNDVAALQRGVEVLEKPHLAGALRRGAVARNGDEVERHGARRHGAREVGEKHERTLQHGDEMQRLAVGIVRVDLRGHFVDAGWICSAVNNVVTMARTIT